eukprot:Hpha_TRINITY_DN15231_c1_g11::TRINITY_DN15231_c1_g11_i1::g.67638::m.67638
MGLSDDELALVIVLGVIGLLLTWLASFYSAYSRLPHCVRNLFRLPPLLSCKAMDLRHQSLYVYDHTQIDRRLLSVTVPSNLLIVVLLVLVFYEETDPLSASSWNEMYKVAHCADALNREKLFSVPVAKAWNLESDVTSVYYSVAYSNTRAETDKLCKSNQFQGWGDIEQARAATNAGNVNLVSEYYSSATYQTINWAADVAHKTLSGNERVLFAEYLGFLTANAATLECGTMMAGAARAVVSTNGLTKLHPTEFQALMSANTTLDLLLPLFRKFADSASSAMEGINQYLSDPSVITLREMSHNNVALDYLEPKDITYFRDLAGNSSAAFGQVDTLYEGTVPAMLRQEYDELAQYRKEILVFSIIGLVFAFVCVVVNIWFIVLHHRAVQSEIRLKSDFAVAHKKKSEYKTIHKQFSRLEVEPFDQPCPKESSIDEYYWAVGKTMLFYKPFLSVALFEGDIAEQEQEEVNMENSNYPGGRTHLYPVKLEAGMHFSRISLMTFSTEVCHDLHREDMNTGREEVCEFYSKLIELAVQCASHWGGIVHSIFSGSIVCTWNLPLDCDRKEERALGCGFKLSKDFQYALREKEGGYNIVPDGESLAVAVCSGSVIAGTLKIPTSRRTVMIGPPLLLAERIVAMCPCWPEIPVLIDQETQSRLPEWWYCRPIYKIVTGEGDCIVHEVHQQWKNVSEERQQDYKEAFVFYRKGKTEEAIEAFQKYIANISGEKYGRATDDRASDRAAEQLLKRLQLEKAAESERQRRLRPFQGQPLPGV